jgi:very-short-patch-repair endonuclease
MVKRDPFRVLLAVQDGVLARRQWLAAGGTAKAWNWKLRLNLWQPVIPGVVVTHSGLPTDRQLAWASVLHAGSDAALSGDAALLEHGFQLRKVDRLDVVVPKPRRVVGSDLLGGRRLVCRTLTTMDPLALHAGGVPSVTPAAAALRAASWSTSERAAEWRLAAVVQQGLTTPQLLRTTLQTMTDLDGREAFSRILDDVELGADAGSELEFLKFLRRHGLPEPDELQVLVRTATGQRYLDGRYVRQRVAVEIDGAHHRDVAQWNADALRALQLAVVRRGSGETVIRLTTGNLRHDGPEVARLLRELLT